ncbi:MAG: DUF2703 domain-containing protein [Nitrososphaerota archaeon]|nr:DUF2703 domain-containing protein [Nitrososphaerota archaeon]MDG7024173.1 DUF2703 domain-containing protein [Nitrososphaerota archaeon]
MSKTVELLCFERCPTYKTTLRDLEEIVNKEALDVRVVLTRVDSDDDAKRLRFLGSPTVRVDGVDIDQTARGSSHFGLRCRVYRVDGRALDTPSRELLRRALKEEPA